MEEYKLLVKNVINAAIRRGICDRLDECKRVCHDGSSDDIEQKIYSILDNVMMEFASKNDVPPYKDVVDKLWADIESGEPGIPFKLQTLNFYSTIKRGELFLFAGDTKQGKSMMLLNCAVDLLKRGYKVLYIDSELNSKLFTCRLMSHLTEIEFRRVENKLYNEQERKNLADAIEWTKTTNFTHLYLPMFDSQSIYTVVKKVNHTQGIDVLIIDYFKSKSEGDAFASYQEMGKLVDMVKNKICGDMNICGLGAVQATAGGKIADSAKIARHASAVAIISEKSPEEIEADGEECGNKKLFVRFNRNGRQMYGDEYIDLDFQGDIISFTEAKQHIPTAPF